MPARSLGDIAPRSTPIDARAVCRRLLPAIVFWSATAMQAFLSLLTAFLAFRLALHSGIILALPVVPDVEMK